MTYVVSNIHGCYADFTALLKEINFSKNDVMFVLGDIVDIGDAPIELVCDLSVRENVWPVAGEHDKLAAEMLEGFSEMLKEGKSKSSIARKLKVSRITLLTYIKKNGLTIE